MRVRDLMTRKVFTARPDKRLLVAREIMDWAHVRHVPVVDERGRLVGMVSHRDLLRASVSTLHTTLSVAERDQHLAQLTVAQVMQHPVHTVTPDTHLRVAAHRMREQRFGALCVVEDERLVGILTEADLLGLVERLPDAVLDQARPLRAA
jgi:CBS domain-containing protein